MNFSDFRSSNVGKILIRAFHTFCQALLGGITVGAAITDLDWQHMLSIAATSAIYSLLKSIVLGVPENDVAGTLIIQDKDDETMSWHLNIETPLDEVEKSSSITLKVDNKNLSERK